MSTSSSHVSGTETVASSTGLVEKTDASVFPIEF